MTKLTLRMEENLIERAKGIAQSQGMSLSRMVAGFFRELARASEADEDGDDDLPPITRRLSGLLADADTKDLTEEAYRAHLEDKHL